MLKIASFIVFLFTIAAAAVIIVTNPVQSREPSSFPVEARRPVYTGAWAGGFWDSKTKTLNTKALSDFESAIGTKVAFANIYSEWTYLENPELLTHLNEISSNGWTPIVSANPIFFAGCPDTGESLYRTIASGDCDEFMRKAGANLKQYNKPVFLRFAWEMNLPSMYWSVDKVGSMPEDFINAWRRFHTMVREGGGDNVVWVLSFNTSSDKTIPYKELYPGHEYVDWVAIDGYNWGETQDWSGWATFDAVFRQSYHELAGLSAKPIMLSEVNSASAGGNRASWFRDMLTKQVPEAFVEIEAIVFFNEDKFGAENVDWRIDTVPEDAAAVRDGLRHEVYKESYP